MNQKYLSFEDEKSPLPPFFQGGFKVSLWQRGFRGIWVFTIKPGATGKITCLTATWYYLAIFFRARANPGAAAAITCSETQKARRK
jgi:hypothetical protein